MSPFAWIVVAFSLGFGGATAVEGSVMPMRKVMVSPVAGQWYPDTKQALEDDLAERTRDLHAVRKPNVCAAVVPHAGYRFSGRVAAGVFMRIDPRKLKRILVIGPSHYVAMRNKLSMPDATVFKTPLGELPVDIEFAEKLRKLPFVVHEPAAHAREHSDQIQLPLIQTCLSTSLPVVCMVCGQWDSAHLIPAAKEMAALIDEGTLIVISSDFTHYGASYGYVPFTQDVEKNIQALDMNVFELFARKDLIGFMEYLDKSGDTVCGRDPLSLLLAMLPKDAVIQRTGYETSGHLLNDKETSVSYIGAVVTGHWTEAAAKAEAEAKVKREEKISEAGCRDLLKLARATIASVFAKGEKMARAPLQQAPSEELASVRGGFVTLTIGGELRGCIGEILPSRPIWRVVGEQAINAAFGDPRFEPLSQEEFKRIKVEISILTPPKPVRSWRQIEIGRHGVVLAKDGRSAVFLPQVAPEQGWCREEMLTHLALKAGLPPDAWQAPDATFMVFEAQVIHE